MGIKPFHIFYFTRSLDNLSNVPHRHRAMQVGVGLVAGDIQLVPFTPRASGKKAAHEEQRPVSFRFIDVECE